VATEELLSKQAQAKLKDYLAPELLNVTDYISSAKKNSPVTDKIDVWAVGVM
jgi:hypothetical protein